tara:strand:- start:176 stop:508 length:333 start_codon:yes stop_codon:yes gene_type:complete
MLIITAHGNLGRDPELRNVNQTEVANFSLAARTGKDETTWIECQVWGKPAQTVCKYLSKGDKIVVSGQGKIRVYEKTDGTESRSLDLKVNDFTLPPKKETVKAANDNIPF